MQLVIAGATWAATALGASAATAATIGTVAGWVAAAAYVGYSLFGASRNRQSQEGPRLGDLSVQSSARGAPLARVWGSLRVSGNLIDGQKYEEKQEEEVGGKGFGGGGGSQISYHYFADFAVTLCEGPIVAVRRIWLNNKLWYDVSDTASATTLGASGERAQYFKLYTGTATQSPDPTLEAIHGAGQVPPYRHTAYLVFKRLPLENYGNGIPNVSVEVITSGSGTLPAITQFDTPGGAEAVDPETGRLWVQSGTAGEARVYNTDTGTLIQAIPLGFNQMGSGQMAYVPTTRKFWAASNKPGGTTTPDLVIIDADALVVSATVEFSSSAFHWPGTCMYNPVGNYVLVAGVNGITNGDTSVHDGITGAHLGWLSPDPPHWVFQAIAAEEYGYGVFSGFGDWLWVFPLAMTESPPDVFSVAPTTFNVAAFTATTGNRISYDRGRALIWWANTASTSLYKLDLATLTLSLAGTLPELPTGGLVYSDASDRLYQTNNVSEILYVIHPDTLAVEESMSRDPGASITLFAHDGSNYLVGSGAFKIPINKTWPQNGVALSQIVTDLCVEAGLSAADIDVTQLTDTVHGYVRSGPMETAQALQPLLAGFLFDGQESDYSLKFPKRGGASVATVLEDDLAAHEPGQELPVPLRIARAQETELPQAISIHYMDPAKDYQQGAQHDTRVITSARHTVQLDLPIAMSATNARRLARILMDNAWVERHRYECAVPIDYLKLDPADVVSVKAHAATHLLRLVRTDFGTPGILRCEGVAERVTTLPPLDTEPAVTAQAPIYTADDDAPPDTFPTQPLLPLAVTRLALMDVPILRDQDSDPGYYYALAPYITGEAWPGGLLYKSTDGGASYAALDGMTSAAALGSATTVLATGPATIWDNGNTLTVRLNYGSLASDTELNVLAGNNAAALGAHGRWEIIQWQTATLNGDGTYTLSKLLRGRKGTEHNVGNHQIGDTFAALTVATVDRVSPGSAELTLERHYKAVTIRGSLQEATAHAFTNTGVGLECYAPVNIKGTRVASGDLTITWIRRTRGGGEWRDSVDVPLFESSELYDLEIWDAGYTTLKRTFADLATASQVYTSAQQVTDFGSNQAAVAVRVYQKSAIVGRGYPGSATV